MAERWLRWHELFWRALDAVAIPLLLIVGVLNMWLFLQPWCRTKPLNLGAAIVCCLFAARIVIKLWKTRRR